MIEKIVTGIILFITLLIVTMTIYIANYTPKTEKIDSIELIVILGAGFFMDGEPVLALEKRLDKGIEFWRRFPDADILISGNMEEVAVMEKYLRKKEIKETDLIKDIEGKNTKKTVQNTGQYVREKSTVAFISQAYHLLRVKLYAQRYGIKNVYIIPTEKVEIPIYEMYVLAFRETMGILWYLVFDTMNLFYTPTVKK